jgi:hypothetical protein
MSKSLTDSEAAKPTGSERRQALAGIAARGF